MADIMVVMYDNALLRLKSLVSPQSPRPLPVYTIPNMKPHKRLLGQVIEHGLFKLHEP